MRITLVAAALMMRCLPVVADDTFSPALFWWWNSKLDVKELCAQVDDFYEHGSQTLCIHPFPKDFRPGRFPCDMEPDYLTDGYLDIFAAVTDHAAAKGMTCWFYDEGGWPSGGVCGKIMASDPVRFARRWMTMDKAGRLKVVLEKYDPSLASPYPSVIEPGVTEMFLSMTHERVKKWIGRHFGKAVPWLFTDEPSVPHSYDRLGWCSDFEREFRSRKGYDIMPFVPDLIRSQKEESGSDEVKRVRIDYYDVMSQLFLDRFLLPCRDWCRKNNLLYGGHYDGDNDMRCALTHGHGHLLRSLRAMDIPGIDCIWRQIHPDSDYTPMPRYASSVAHQIGAKRVLSETFAIYGESLFPDIMKRTVDFQMVRGVNQFVFAFACQSTKRNFMSIGDPHLGPSDPKWAFMKSFNDYVRDTCARLAEGTNPVRVAVYFDVRSVWAGGHDVKGEGEAAYRAQIEVAKGLDARQVDFDFVDDDMIEAGRLPYEAIVFPTDRYLSAKGKAALDAFRARGGLTLGPDELDKVPRTCRVTGAGSENIRATKRILPDGSVDYFLVNESDRTLSLNVTFGEAKEMVRVFDPYGSEFVRIRKDGRVEAKPLPKPMLARRTLERGWTVRKVWSVKPGAEDFECETHSQSAAVPCELGDWGRYFGTNFSGRAVYRTEFLSAPSEAYLDLGKVGVCAEASLNGKKLSSKFFGPFRWAVMLEAGTNILEVTVGNTLANALIPELERIGREFPPASSYTFREKVFYEKDDMSSGLIGPVRLDITKVLMTGKTCEGLPSSEKKVKALSASVKNRLHPDLGENPYGIAAHLLNRKEEMRVVDESLKMIADAGIGWIRIDLLWQWVQREKGGAFDFAKYDSLLDRMERYGLEPLFILCDPPRWARPMNRHLDDWRAFVKAVMERYGKRIKAVEVWNEPNADRFWNPFFDIPFSPAAYYEIHRAASEVIRETAPSVRISTAGFTGVPLNVMEDIYKLGGKDTFDIVNVHPYARPEPPEGDLDRRVIALRDLMTRYGDKDKPIWITEIGWPTPEVRMACPTVIGEGLRQAWPGKKSFRVAYCGIEPETEDPTGSLLAEVRGVLPEGSRVVNVPPSELAGVLSRREVDVVMYPLCNGRFATGTFAAVTNFVAQGGTLILPGNLPLQTPMKHGADGRFVFDPSVNNGTARKSVRLGWSWISDANGKKVRAKFAPASGTSGIRMKTPQRWNDFCSGPITLNEKFLKPGDWMIPLLTAEIDGKQIVGAAVYRFGSDWKGAVIATTIESERGAFTEAEQASRLKRALALAFASSVEKVFIYEFMAPEEDPVYRESHYGIVHPDLTPKPAFEAYRDFIRKNPFGR